MQFSIKSTLVLMLAIASGLSAYLVLTKDYRERKAMERELLNLGASYAHVAKDRKISLVFSKPIAVGSLEQYGEIKLLELKRMRLDPGTVEALSRLKKIDVLHFQMCTVENVDDLAFLANSNSIRLLLVWNCNATDEWMETIGKISGLEMASFVTTEVSQQGIDRLKQLKPEIQTMLMQ